MNSQRSPFRAGVINAVQGISKQVLARVAIDSLQEHRYSQDGSSPGMRALRQMTTAYGIAIVSLIAAVLATLIVFLHYEVLNFLSKTLARLVWVGRPRIAILFFTLLIVHIVEIWIFAGGFLFAEWHGGLGELKGEHGKGIFDYVYFSSMTFTTVGYGDLVPIGALRFLAAMEALSGLMLITWSASFIYLEMTRFWREK